MIFDLDVLKFTNRKKLSIVLQASESETALACMTMLANYHGNNVDLSQVRSEYSLSSRGTTIKCLMNLAENMGFSSRVIKVSIEKLNRLQTPCILSWGENHFVVLNKIKNKVVHVHDPAIGACEYSFEEVAAHLNGVALELTPSVNFQKTDKPPEVKLSSFWSKIVGLKSTLIKIFLLSITLQMIAIAMPFYMQFVIDDVLVARDLDLLTILAIGFSLLLLLEIVNFGIRTLTVAVMGNQLTLQLNANVIQHLFKLPLRYFETRHIGDVMSRISSLNTIRQVLTTTIIESLVDGIMIIGLLAVMYFYSPMLANIVVSVTVIYFLFRLIYYGPYKNNKRKLIVAKAKQNTNLIESVRGMQTVKLYNQENERLNQYSNLNVEACNHGMQSERLKVLFILSEKLLTGVEQIVIVYFAAKLVISGELSVGMIFAFLSYKTQFREKAVKLIEGIITYKMMSLDLERLADIALSEQEQNRGVLDNDYSIDGDIELKNVCFRYADDEKFVLNNVSLKIKNGESVAIAGTSGCGKSTLVKIILGLLTPTSGEVFVDGQNIKKIGLQNYRSTVGCVMQSETLLAGTILQNISFFAVDPDIELVKECAKKAGIHEDIMSMSMDYHSLIGDMGASLSGGQKQRIVIARALYRNPSVLILDEATSALDTETENEVINSLKNMKMTRIFVAHRPQTIRSADRVIKFDNGIVNESEDYAPKAEAKEPALA
ncbi:peptidase domain-containing ABC transporter [Aliikangiella marina]|uniref:Peptidase domain-containing ABC transporter n=1 Tax=Aliikangiella marina TaxID=1712262 RepID=A0A545TJH3_9GAMM|nr:peptidase domain-containing ABC transporter [Aliikangiella marina]TQV77363.1 peptidase domain-containing ABC transporter [Aliikangiella marina]